MKFKKQNGTAKNKMEVSDADVTPAQTGPKKNNLKRKTTNTSGQFEVEPKMKKIELVKPQTENVIKVNPKMKKGGKVAPEMKKVGKVAPEVKKVDEDEDTPKIEMIASPVAKSMSRKMRKKKLQSAENKLVKQEAKLPDSDRKELAIDYLKLWKNDRAAWKFAKIRQVWLNNNMLDESKVSDEMFPVYLEYMAGSAKRQKHFAMKKSKEVLEELEDNASTADAQAPKYTRAKKIIQSMDSGESNSE